MPQDPAKQEDKFEFVYDGPDVAAGSMRLRDLIEVAGGLKTAFSLISQEREMGDDYEIRIRDFEHSSVHLWFEIVAFAKTNPAAATAISAGGAVFLNAATNITSGAYKIVSDLGLLVEAKKWLRGRRVAVLPAIFPDGSVEIETPDGRLTLTKEQYSLLLSQRIDKPLAKIVSPLGIQRVDNFKMNYAGETVAQVELREREYFDYAEVREDRSRQGTEITGTINSLSKNNLRGTFYTAEGIHVPYRYAGGDLNQLYRGFTSHEPLRVYGEVKYGVDGIPRHVEMQAIEFLQRNLPVT